MKTKKLILIGDGATAEICFEYFKYDSDYEVHAFAVHAKYKNKDVFHGLPVVEIESLESNYSATEYEVFVAITFAQLNRTRTQISYFLKQKGYRLASYISSRAFVWRNVKMGEHCFIFEDNTVQPFVELGNNVILWSGNHIGHHSVIHDNCFISSHVVVSGFCEIGENSFLGVNTTLADGIKIGKDNWIGPGLTITKDTDDNLLFSGNHAEASRVSTKRFFKIKEEA
jgi:sugar O-acyltransferase (sialic acid O-acetyltransferase NeuD family)